MSGSTRDGQEFPLTPNITCAYTHHSKKICENNTEPKLGISALILKRNCFLKNKIAEPENITRNINYLLHCPL